MTRIILYTMIFFILSYNTQDSKKNGEKSKKQANKEQKDSNNRYDTNTNMKLNKTGKRKIYHVVSESPEFPGGQDSLHKYLNQTLNYPESAQKENIEGKVIIEFVVDTNGTVKRPKILKGLTKNINKECIDAIQSMPKWVPGKQRGKPVEVPIKIPFKFSLNSESEPKKLNDNKLNFKIFPNPANRKFYISIEEMPKNLSYQIIALNGNKVNSGVIRDKKQKISLDGLETGVYYVRLVSETNKFKETKKLFKK